MKIKSLLRVQRSLAGMLALSLMGSVGSLRADEVYSQIVGAIAVTVPQESDVVLSFPFKQSASFRGAVVGVSGGVVTVAADSFTGGEFDGARYYVFVEDSASDSIRGRRINVESNTASTIDLGGADLTGLAVDDVLSVRAHWTLGDAFPDGFGGQTEDMPGIRELELIVPDAASVGGGLAASKIFYHYDGAWREVGEPLNESADNAVLLPGAAFVVRNNNATDPVKAYFFGEVVHGTPLAIPVLSDAGKPVDNFVSLERPLSLTLDQLVGGAGAGIEDVLGAGDALLVYGLDTGKNKTPTAYEYTGSQWQEVGDTVNAGSVEIKAEQGIAIRRAAGSSSANWINEWDLPQ